VVTSIDILKKKLESLGHEVALFVPSGPGVRDNDLSVHRFFSVTVPIHKESRFSIFNPFGHVKRLRRLGPDVIHVHTPFNLGALGVWSSDRLRIPYVFTHHTLWEEYVHYVPLVSQRLLRRTAIGICRYFCNHSGGVIAPSDEVRDRLLEQGVTTRVEVIPTGIDVELFHEGDPERVRRELGWGPEVPIAIYAGRMGKEKSIDFVLDAFKRMREEMPEARLLLLGGGPEQVNLEEHARRIGIIESVRFTGYVPRASMVDYLQAARVFLFASTTETQGLVSLEAQAAGIPVVAVRASGSNEAVRDGETGFLVEADREVFAQAALRLMRDDRLQARLGSQARAWANACSSQRMADRHLELYRAASHAPRAAAADPPERGEQRAVEG
jgi:glycosyltransferase involved in cell wall biosynthesis